MVSGHSQLFCFLITLGVYVLAYLFCYFFDVYTVKKNSTV